MVKNEYSIARINKDSKYDGRFFFGVKTTGIFCRPSCPSPIAKEENVRYFSNIYEPINHGFRPCLRCRPDIYTEKSGYNVDASSVVGEAINLISSGFLNKHSVIDLAKELNVSDRHLRKLFAKEVGLSPIKMAKYHRIIFAKKLLLNSNLNITKVAFASGFGSIRQFNNVFKEFFNTSPTEFKRLHGTKYNNGNIMTIPYKKDFDYKGILMFMEARLIKGVESVIDDVYSRTFKIDGVVGHLTIKNNSVKHHLEIEVFCEDMKVYMEIYYRVKRMFDIDTDIECIREHFKDDPILKYKKVQRLPIAFDAFEFVIRAILGQQITIKAATTLAGRIVEKVDLRYENEDGGLTHLFPDIMDIDGICLRGLGITNTRVRTIESVVEGLKNQVFTLSINQDYDKFSKEFKSIKGIGDWTVNYVAMRGLGMPNAFPASDLGVIKALTIGTEKPSNKEILKRAEAWKPYRAYGALCLWTG